MNKIHDERRLEVPDDVLVDEAALELIAVWFSNGKVKVLTRDGTPMDERLNIWAQVVAGVVENIADHASGYDDSRRREVERRIGEMVVEELNKG